MKQDTIYVPSLAVLNRALDAGRKIAAGQLVYSYLRSQ